MKKLFLSLLALFLSYCCFSSTVFGLVRGAESKTLSVLYSSEYLDCNLSFSDLKLNPEFKLKFDVGKVKFSVEKNKTCIQTDNFGVEFSNEEKHRVLTLVSEISSRSDYLSTEINAKSVFRTLYQPQVKIEMENTINMKGVLLRYKEEFSYESFKYKFSLKTSYTNIEFNFEKGKDAVFGGIATPVKLSLKHSFKIKSFSMTSTIISDFPDTGGHLNYTEYSVTAGSLTVETLFNNTVNSKRGFTFPVVSLKTDLCSMSYNKGKFTFELKLISGNVEFSVNQNHLFKLTYSN